MKLGIRPSEGPWYVEQSVLAATICTLEVAVQPMPDGYNYPLHLHARMPAELRLESLESATSIHYHRFFDKPRLIHPLRALEGLDSSPKLEWLITQLQRQDIYPRRDATKWSARIKYGLNPISGRLAGLARGRAGNRTQEIR